MNEVLRRWALTLGVICAPAGCLAGGQSGPPAMPARPAARGRVVAVIADASLVQEAPPVAGLLEARLSKRKGLRLVDRTQIRRVLAELKLNLMLSPAGAAERRRAGKILKADLLIALRGRKAKDLKYVDVVVCETAGGLRLLVRSVILSKRPEDDAAEIEKLVRQALAKLDEQIVGVCAVPPFVSGDLTHRYDHLQAAYARLIEQMLLNQKGILVVELAEARAIARELLLSGSGEGPRRPLPLYLLGEYRHSGRGEDRKLTVTLTLKRGRKTLAGLKKADLAPPAAPGFLRKSARQLLGRATGKKTPAADASLEAAQLAERGYAFFRIGNWKEAPPLLAASLLLDGDQEKAHCYVVSALTELINLDYRVTDDKHTVAKAPEALNKYRMGMSHMEWLLRQGGFQGMRDANNDARMLNFIGRFMRAGELFDPTRLKRPDRDVSEVEPLYRQIMMERREMWFRVLAHRTRAKTLTWPIAHSAGTYMFYPSTYGGGETRAERDALRLRALRIIASDTRARYLANFLAPSPPSAFVNEAGEYYNKPDHAAFRAFLEKMSKIPGRGIQQAVADLRKSYQAGLAKPRVVKHYGPFVKPEGGEPDADVIIRKLRLTLTDGSDVATASDAYFLGWRPCGQRADVAWNRRNIFLMKQAGKLKRIYHTEEKLFRFRDLLYDGRYVWAPVKRGSSREVKDGLVLVIDPASEKLWRFTASDGLPPMSGGAAAAAIEPGKIFLAGSFGRAWLAILTFQPGGRKSVKVFHEARLRRDPKKDSGAEAWKTGIAFHPGFIVTDRPPEWAGRLRVLMGRGIDGVSRRYPLLVDPEKGTFKVVALDYGASIPAVKYHDGAIYWTGGGSRRLAYKKVQWWVRVYRAALPDLKIETVVKHFVPPGEWMWPDILFYGGRIHLIGSQWWSAEDFGKDFVRMRTRFVGHRGSYWRPSDIPGRVFQPGCRRRYCTSRHYGLLLLARREGVFQLVLDNRLKVRAARGSDVAKKTAPAK